MFGVFGINNDSVNLAVNLLILFLVVIYLSLIYWTFADARRRIADGMLVACATAASLFPFVGTIVYMIVRPPEYLDDVRERELEMQAAEARLHDMDHQLCPHCDYPVQRDFIRCPSCLRRLKDPCINCQKPLDPAWPICPYCETEVPGAVEPQPTRRRSRRSRRDEYSDLGETAAFDISSDQSSQGSARKPGGVRRALRSVASGLTSRHTPGGPCTRG